MGTIKHKDLVDKICKAIVEEAIESGVDFWDDSWSNDYNLKVTLTVGEIKMAAKILNYKPEKDV